MGEAHGLLQFQQAELVSGTDVWPLNPSLVAPFHRVGFMSIVTIRE